MKKDFTYRVNKIECTVCGICSFDHIHRAGTKPKDFEMIPEEIKCKKHGVVHKNGGYPSCPGNRIKELDEDVNAKLISLSNKYPDICSKYLMEMHKILDWAEAELKKIK